MEEFELGHHVILRMSHVVFLWVLAEEYCDYCESISMGEFELGNHVIWGGFG